MNKESVLEAIRLLQDPSDLPAITQCASSCAALMSEEGMIGEVVATLDDTLQHGNSQVRAALWLFLDRLCKQDTAFVEELRSKVVGMASRGAPSPTDKDAFTLFLIILDSLKAFFGNSAVALMKLKVDPTLLVTQPLPLHASSAAATGGTAGGGGGEYRGRGGYHNNNSYGRGGGGGYNARQQYRMQQQQMHRENQQQAAAASRALIAQSAQLRSLGSFVTKLSNRTRSGAERGVLNVRTVDSMMAMSMASAYAPARPVEIRTPMAPRDAAAPQGHVQALPENHSADYLEQRRKRLRSVMEENRRDDDRKARERLLVVSATGATAGSEHNEGQGEAAAATALAAGIDFSDVTMPEELPRDAFGVKRGNFPQGVRFIRDAIRDCGGVVELEVIVQRISTLSRREFVAEFGDVREFLLLHKPTFDVVLEGEKWVVRLSPTAYPKTLAASREPASVTDRCMAPPDALPQGVSLETSCPYCTRLLKSRNLLRHLHCRRCVSTQMGLGLQGTIRGPISELGYASKWVIDHARQGAMDDDDILWLACCIERCANIRRYRLSSPNKFLPVLKAIRCVRDFWVLSKGLPVNCDMSSVPVDSGDAAIAVFFHTVGSNIFRLPLAWIELGDIVAFCSRFCNGVKPAHNPPPRPADPRISLLNEYPGMLLCESEIDSEDEPSEDELAFSDDESEGFQFAPPVTTIETLTVAGFERDTRRLNHKLRTAPPLLLTRVLKGDSSQTHTQMYAAAAKEKAQGGGPLPAGRPGASAGPMPPPPPPAAQSHWQPSAAPASEARFPAESPRTYF